MTKFNVKILDTSRVNPEELRLLLTRPAIDEVQPSEAVVRRTAAIFGRELTPVEAVQQILSDVETYGDAAVLDYAEKIDGVKLTQNQLFVHEDEIEEAMRAVDPDVLSAIRLSVERIRRFHELQKERSWFEQGDHGELFGQRLLPLERVGCYVPGGTAPLLSTAVMSVVPAKVAGVSEVIVATPCNREGHVHPYVLAALNEAGADRIVKVGGAQAVGALAYGTTWIPKVDKIVGPGNLFVTLAKKEVFGRVGIDALNGPSEVAIIADHSADPALVAADLLAQAEHDSAAVALLFTPEENVAQAVSEEINKQLIGAQRAELIRQSLDSWGGIVVCRDLSEALYWVNHVAAEHVQLFVEDPWSVMPGVKFAGAIFLGPLAPVALGDYIAGPNHILPTNGTARFASPLGVYDFVRRTSVLSFNEQAYSHISNAAEKLARIEGLHGHADALVRRNVPGNDDVN